ncbi:Translation initiation factor IF-2, mitochondrial [Lecanosticta acicola]|uniref:Translation initiation factor IF-2, mitochondrial n=1 Tax=Lecanosticta acicola TaxID=111012 RepID=A0AAI9EFU2_9PEZI|nr:Translation initiation factor IF-2, mitochondrial [Lecanosticta acicola]
MRRQRVLRTSSAQSLCIFCACRLGFELPPSQFAPFVSNTARRGLTSSSASSQSAAAAAAAPIPNNGDASNSSFPGYDPNFSLTSAEQQESARKQQIRQEQEAQQNDMRPEQTGKVADAERTASRPDRSGNGQLRTPRNDMQVQFRSVSHVGNGDGVEGIPGGVALSQSIFGKQQAKKDRPQESDSDAANLKTRMLSNGSSDARAKENRPQKAGQDDARRKARVSSEAKENRPQKFGRGATDSRATRGTFRKYAVDPSIGDSDARPKKSQPQRHAKDRDQRESGRLFGPQVEQKSLTARAIPKVANPFAAPAKSEKGNASAAAPVVGWGASATQMHPVKHAPESSLKRLDPSSNIEATESASGGLNQDIGIYDGPRSESQSVLQPGQDEVDGKGAQDSTIPRPQEIPIEVSPELPEALFRTSDGMTDEIMDQASMRDDIPDPEPSSPDHQVPEMEVARPQQISPESVHDTTQTNGDADAGFAQEVEAADRPTEDTILQTSGDVDYAFAQEAKTADSQIEDMVSPTNGDVDPSFARETQAADLQTKDTTFSTPADSVSDRYQKIVNNSVPKPATGNLKASDDADEWIGFGLEEDGMIVDQPEATTEEYSGYPGVFEAYEEQYEGAQPGVAQQRPEPDATQITNRGRSRHSTQQRSELRRASDDLPPGASIRPTPSPGAFTSSENNDNHLQTKYSRDQKSHLQDSNRSESSNCAVPQYPEKSQVPPQQPQQGGAWGLGAFGAALQPNSESQGRPLTSSNPNESSPAQQPRDAHGVGQKPQQGNYSDTGYRAMPLDRREMQSSLSEEDVVGDWQHFRRRESEESQQPHPPSASQQQQQQQHMPPFQQRKSRELDVQTVDDLFARHQQQRPQRRPEPTLNAEQMSSQALFNDSHSGPFRQMKCARCGELGHRARECTGPNRMRCNECGQIGHGSWECPQKKPWLRKAEGQRRENVEQGRVPNPFGQGATVTHEPASTENQLQIRTPVSYGSEFPRFQSKAKESESAVDQPYSPFSVRPQQPLEDRRQREEKPPSSFIDSVAPDSVQAEEEEVPRRARDKAARASRWADVEEEDDSQDMRRRKDKKSARRRGEDDEDDGDGARDEYRAKKSARKLQQQNERKRNREARKAEETTPIALPEFISVQHLSQMLDVRYEQFVKRLEQLGYDDVFPGKTLNSETSGMIAMEYNFEPTFDMAVREEEERDLKARPAVEDTSLLPTRPPVVTIMGHVDHGKTTILDYLRKSSVAASEAGGITQHIGAFSVPLSSSGRTITFLDTPGHAAFLAMRQRGANVTDIVILVVAADDSVKPQTLEAIKHAKGAGVPIVVAINKVDKPEADIERCKQDLARHGVEIEDYGGDTQVVCVSGKTGQGMDDLEETVVTLSEILDHRADRDGDVEGWVLEATTKQAGRVATVLVRRGTLRPGAVIVAGKTWARVRTLKNEGGQTVDEVGPGMPVEVDGWKDQPIAGDEVLQARSEQKATDVVEFRLEREELKRMAQDTDAINEARRIAQEKREQEKVAGRAAKHGDPETESDKPASKGEHDEQSGQMLVPFIIKADVSGSVEAVSAYIMSVSNPLIAPQVLQAGVGNIHESDIDLAATAQGHIIAFNLPPDNEMKGAAEARGVKVLENNVIYRVLDDIKSVLEEKLPPLVTQRVLGEAEVGAAFEIGIGGRKKLKIAGCKIRNGVVNNGSMVRVFRNGEKIYDGVISSLKNVKKDVQEMRKGTECGMGFEKWEDFEVGDQIQTYEEVSEKRKL